ncbi:MAG: Hpt domain-containing protein, partial [Polaromonas sp.]|nr:Hpt domain-containing protein [Polaromonas sp.]
MVTNSTTAKPDFAMNDLGPLAWVLDELRKSLNSATKALKRFAWDAEAARGSDLAAIDASQLRIARQQLHQAVGALEMVGLTGPVLMLRAMEAAVQKFVLQPEHCSQEAVAKIEYASFALTEYLEGVLADRPVSPVSLFPQYRDVQDLVRADRIHPADLWPLEWRWAEPKLAVTAEPRQYGTEARAIMDQSVLQLMKGKAPQAAGSLGSLSLGFAAQQTERRLKIFWIIAAGYFEAVAHDLLGTDLYIRRVASRVLLQYASLAKGDTSVSERLAHDMVFFCAQAAASQASATPVLAAVRSAYGLSQFKPVNYELVQFGRFDPALLAQARKRIVSAKEAWSSLCAGDTSKAKTVADQFALVTESLLKLHPPSEPLAQVLSRAIETTVNSAQTPGIELAMEVATSVLYLEAVFEDLDPNDPQLAVRTASLAQRLESVRAGGNPQPLEIWMEELYSRVSDKQTMGSVVGELRVSLGELEKSLDAFFRNPKDKATLQTVPGQLSQMRGVLSVLGLDQACKAVFRMKSSVQKMLDTETDPELARAAGTFEYLGNNVGALSFLIDMLNYQPVLAKKLFVYNEENGELKPVMGRAPSASEVAEVAVSVDDSDALPVEVALVVPPGQVVNVAPPAEERSNPALLAALPDVVVAAPVIPVAATPAAAVLAPLDPLSPSLEMLAVAPSVEVNPPAPVQDEGAFDLDLAMDFTDEPVAVPASAPAPAEVKLPAPAQGEDMFDLDLAMDFQDAPVAAAPAFVVKPPALAEMAQDATPVLSDNKPEAAVSALTAMSPPPMQMPVVPVAPPSPPPPPPVVQSSASMDYEEDDDFDLQEIFLEEAREVVGNATQAIDELAQDPADTEQLTVLRRAFHTLKGSARMVELNEFGEAGWALEQMLNSWLADQKPATKEFRTLCAEVIAGFEAWIAAISEKQDASWSATAFRESAEAMRLEGRYVALNLSGQADAASAAVPVVEVVMPVVPVVPEAAQLPEPPMAQESVADALALAEIGFLDEAESLSDLNFDIIPEAEPVQLVALVEPVQVVQEVEPVKVTEAPADASTDSFVTELADIDFDSFFTLSSEEAVSPAATAPLGEELAQSSPAEQVSVEAIELSAEDFAEQFQIGAEAYEPVPPAEIEVPVMAAAPALPEPAPVADVEPVMDEFFFSEDEASVPVIAAEEQQEAPASDRSDENVMVIDGLRIGTALYNVYLGEADQWSSHLVSEVAEWSHENHQLVSASTVALAHSLAGSSATVGFHALSEVARALEHALENSRDHRNYDASTYGPLFVEAAEDIRRLLHQFAAGFLKQPQADILARLKSLEFPESAAPSVDEYDAYSAADESEFAIEDDFEFFADPLPEVQAAVEAEAEAVQAPQAPQALVQAVPPAEIEPAVQLASVAEISVLTKAEFAVVQAERQIPVSVKAEVLS